MLLQQFRVLSKWCFPVIQGYLDSFTTDLPNKTVIKYFLISRRSHRKTGTRFYSRGVDDDGNVANFTETEQMIFFKDYAITHLQIRGRFIFVIMQRSRIFRANRNQWNNLRTEYLKIFEFDKTIFSCSFQTA
jgi:hypothetical protein